MSSSLTLGGAVTLRADVHAEPVAQRQRLRADGLLGSYATFTDYEKGASYDLEVGGRRLHHPEAHQTTVGFDDIQPSSILSDDPYSFPYLGWPTARASRGRPSVSDGVVIDFLVFDSFAGRCTARCSATRRTRAVHHPGRVLRTFFEYDLAGSSSTATKRAPRSINDGSTIQSLSSLGALGSATLLAY